jgi:hypothetical protein
VDSLISKASTLNSVEAKKKRHLQSFILIFFVSLYSQKVPKVAKIIKEKEFRL